MKNFIRTFFKFAIFILIILGASFITEITFQQNEAISEIAETKQQKETLKEEQEAPKEEIIPVVKQAPEERETWRKVDKHIYLDPNSIERDENYASGCFREYIQNEEIKEGKKVLYKIVSVSAVCGSENKNISLPILKYYDSDENFIIEFNPYTQQDRATSEGFETKSAKDEENGLVYYGALCENKE